MTSTSSPNFDETPKTEDVINCISPGLTEAGEALGLAPLTIRAIADSEYLLKIRVESKDQQTLFTIDVSQTSAVMKSELIEQADPHRRGDRQIPDSKPASAAQSRSLPRQEERQMQRCFRH